MRLFIIRANYSYDLRGENAILSNRKLMGATDPKKAEENTQLEKIWTFY